MLEVATCMASETWIVRALRQGLVLFYINLLSSEVELHSNILESEPAHNSLALQLSQDPQDFRRVLPPGSVQLARGFVDAAIPSLT